MRCVLLAVLLLPSVLLADGLYLEAGVGAHAEQYDSVRSNGESWPNGLGMGELGYRYGDYKMFFLHISSLEQKDTGLNMLAIKYRFGGGRKGGCVN